MMINAFIISKGDFAAGLFAPQDLYIFMAFVNKPYTKIYAIFLGIGMALIYDSIQIYKVNLANNIEFKSSWKWLAHNKCLILFSYLIGLTAIGYTTLAPLPANTAPMKWTHLQNTLFITFSRPLFLIGIMLIMTNLVLENGRLLRNALSASFWVPLSRLSYVIYLIFPVINACVISSLPQSLFLSYITMFYLLAFNFVFCIIVGFVLNLFLEAPLYNLIIYH
jgi:peptidoglycan/LPS O-acetylase OafA/YrhL